MCSRRFSRFASPPGQVTRHVFAGPSRRMFRVEWKCTKDAAFSDAAPWTRLYEGGSTACRAVLHVCGYRLILTVRSAPRPDLTLVAGSLGYLPREICARQPEGERASHAELDVDRCADACPAASDARLQVAPPGRPRRRGHLRVLAPRRYSTGRRRASEATWSLHFLGSFDSVDNHFGRAAKAILRLRRCSVRSDHCVVGRVGLRPVAARGADGGGDPGSSAQGPGHHAGPGEDEAPLAAHPAGLPDGWTDVHAGFDGGAASFRSSETLLLIKPARTRRKV